MSNNTKRSGWAWIPSLYFAQGIPYVAVMTVAVIMYKRMGMSNTDIALYTSWLYLPWVIKPLWSPFVDLLKTKRWWIVTMQLLIGAGFAGIAFSIPTTFYVQATLAVFWLVAFSSATHDIAADGFYMIALDEHQQSLFVGIRSTFYRISMIVGQGVLIWIAGALEVSTGTKPIEIVVDAKTEKVAENYMAVDSTASKEIPGDVYFYTESESVPMSIGTIPADSVSKIISFAHDQNVANGFIAAEEKADADTGHSLWNQYVSIPLGSYLKEHFGETVAAKTETAQLQGNVATIKVRISKKPEPGKEYPLNVSFKDGDKSISMAHGERIVFNDKNWDKPAYLAVQVSPNLKHEASATFKGVSGNIPRAWSLTFFLIAALFGVCFAYHRFILPRPAGDHSSADASAKNIMGEFFKTFKTFFQKPGIKTALFFMLGFRFSESQLVKLSSPFMLDAKEVGGLGLTTSQVGLFYGTIGVISLTLGGILGGIAAAKKGLKFWLWPMTLAMTVPNLAYVYLAEMQPDNFFYIGSAVAIEQFGYGFGFTAYMLFLIYFANGEHKTAHYAIATGFMALGMMLPGMMAGWLEELLGYKHFFVYVMLCTLVVFIATALIKIDPKFGVKEKEETL